jgi:uncharacterized protein (TIRG00374 family)
MEQVLSSEKTKGPDGDLRPSRRKLWLFALGAAALAALVTVVLNVGELETFAELVSKAEPSWLALGVLSQAATYGCVGFVWWLVLERLGHPQGILKLAPLAVAKLFADQVMPSGGVTGSLLVVRGLTRRSVPSGDALVAFMFGVGSFFAAFLLASVSSLAFIALNHKGSATVSAIVVSFLTITIAISAAALLFARKPHALPKWIARAPWAARAIHAIAEAAERLKMQRTIFALAVGVQLLLRCCDGLTLWACFQSIGSPEPYWMCFSAIVIGSITATLAPIPLGLGSFEGGSVGALTLLGAPVEAALMSTLLFRGLALWLPLLPGFVASQRLLRPGAAQSAHLQEADGGV